LQFLPGWRSRHQAKSVTNNLPILSVLANGRYVSILIKIFFQSPFIFSSDPATDVLSYSQ
jgi:hypothetical protein